MHTLHICFGRICLQAFRRVVQLCLKEPNVDFHAMDEVLRQFLAFPLGEPADRRLWGLCGNAGPPRAVSSPLTSWSK